MKGISKIFVLLVGLGISISGFGQDMNQMVSLVYINGPSLEYILKDINKKYAVNFAYSNKMIPVHRKTEFVARQKTLGAALDQLFDENAIVYAKIGGQIVLKPDRRKNIGQLTSIQSPAIPKAIDQQSPLYENNSQLAGLTKKEWLSYKKIKPIHHRSIQTLPGGNRIMEFDEDRIKALATVEIPEDEEEIEEIVEEDITSKRLAQVSILPFVGTNAQKSNQVTNHISLNVFWGTNGGLDGFEVGGFANSIKEDAKGVQVAGLGNTVGNNLVGTQVSGLFNVVGEHSEGVQVSGLFNIAKKASGVQAAGLFNIAPKAFSGVQAAALFNVGGEGDGLQVAPIFNASSGSVSTQISALFNVGGDVKQMQISPLLNVAKKVNGFQIGLINVADSISGVPFGILNIVKKGYNRVEIGAGETLTANASLKLGVRSFYNIFHVGARRDKMIDANDNTSEEFSWGLGYGIGSAIQLEPWLLMNFEGLAVHVNEGEQWTNQLNLLTQFKILMDVRLSRRMSLFFGPSGNIMFSRLEDLETGQIGSNIMPYTFYDETNGTTNTKMWVGFNGGLRF